MFKQILEEYDPEYESMGLDEVNIDATNYLIEKGVNNDEGREALALEIRTRINEATNLTCSAGIANNKMLAKVRPSRTNVQNLNFSFKHRFALI